MPIPMNESWRLTKKYIDDTLAKTPNSKELILVPHLEKCLNWGLKLCNSAGCALKITLYGHDIERAFNNRVQKKDFSSYTVYKKQHSMNSAVKLTDYLTKIGSDKVLVNEVYELVKYHDVGYVTGMKKHLYSDLRFLRDADAISFLDDSNAIEIYISQNGLKNTEEKMKFMFGKLSRQARARPEVVKLYQKCMALVAQRRKIATIDDFI